MWWCCGWETGLGEKRRGGCVGIKIALVKCGVGRSPRNIQRLSKNLGVRAKQGSLLKMDIEKGSCYRDEVKGKISKRGTSHGFAKKEDNTSPRGRSRGADEGFGRSGSWASVKNERGEDDWREKDLYAEKKEFLHAAAKSGEENVTKGRLVQKKGLVVMA